MKKKKESFPLMLHGVVSLLLPIPCFLIMFVVNAFLALLVPESAEASGGISFISILPMLISPVFSLSGIWRSFRRFHRSKRARTCMVMSALGLVGFIVLMVFGLRY